MNAVSVAYDLHVYNGIEDPGAQENLKRLRALLAAAHEIGLSTGIMLGANQAYNNSPKELRAVGPGRGEWVDSNLMPPQTGSQGISAQTVFAGVRGFLQRRH